MKWIPTTQQGPPVISRSGTHGLSRQTALIRVSAARVKSGFAFHVLNRNTLDHQNDCCPSLRDVRRVGVAVLLLFGNMAACQPALFQILLVIVLGFVESHRRDDLRHNWTAE